MNIFIRETRHYKYFAGPNLQRDWVDMKGPFYSLGEIQRIYKTTHIQYGGKDAKSRWWLASDQPIDLKPS